LFYSYFTVIHSFLKLVQNRRSIRRFKSDPIPDEYVIKIIEAARWAPSGFNLQPWEFVVVKKQELKESIVQLITEYSRAHYQKTEVAREQWQGSPWQRKLSGEPMDYRNAPVFVLLFGDVRTEVGLPMTIRYSPHERESIFNSSLSGAFLYMHLAATTLGLASQWVTDVRVPSVHCLLKNLLGIPEALGIYDMIALGYPGSEPRKKLLRAKEKMIHYDSCCKEDFRTDEEVKDFIRRTRTWTISTIRRG
jgi:nitroreductase